MNYVGHDIDVRISVVLTKNQSPKEAKSENERIQAIVEDEQLACIARVAERLRRAT